MEGVRAAIVKGLKDTNTVDSCQKLWEVKMKNKRLIWKADYLETWNENFSSEAFPWAI